MLNFIRYVNQYSLRQEWSFNGFVIDIFFPYFISQWYSICWTIAEILQKEDAESEDDNKIEVDEVARTLPQGTNHTPDALASALSGLSDR